MADLEEVKGLFSDTQKTIEALRSDVESLKGKSVDLIDVNRHNEMKAELAAKFEAEAKAMAARLAAVETAANRPGGAQKSADDEYAKKFADFLRSGENEKEIKAMGTRVGESGGLLVSDGMRAGIQSRNYRTSPIEMIATSVTFSGGSYEILVERDEPGSGWGASESTVSTETTTPTINKISIATHDLRAMPKVPQRLLDVSDYDVEGFLVGRVNSKFARDKATAFVSGSGADRPKGFLSYGKSATADATRAVETLQYRATGASGAFATAGPADVLVRTFYDLQGVYQASASWMMKNTTAAEVAVLKDGDGANLLQSMLNTDGTIVRTIQGRPMYVADDMPAIGADAYAIAVGDFSNYLIVNSPTVSLVRDIYTETPNVLFKFFTRVGGGVTDFDAIKLIKFGTS
jgi:HK97 family phage major capsid protein